MIGKITRGSNMAGLIYYLCGPGRHEEHTRPHVIAASLGVDVPTGEELTGGARRHLAAQLDGPRLGFGVDVAGGHVWHLSLTNRVDDHELTAEQWAEAVRAVMEAQGFDRGDAPGCPWVAIHHGRSKTGNDHVHVAVSLVREDGTRASIWRDRVKLSEACHQLEERYGLIVVDGRTAGTTPAPGRAEMESAARLGRPEPDRPRLARLVRAAAAASQDEAEFVRRLGTAKVLARPRYAPGGRSQVVGYSVALAPTPARTGPGGGVPVWYGGGRLAKDLSLPQLRRDWQTVPDQGAAWQPTSSGGGGRRPGRQAAGGREQVPIAAGAWQEAAQRARAANDRLAGVDPTNRQAWSQAARDAAGVMAALAGRLETDAPGPLSDAADSLARSAQHAAAGTEQRNLAGLASVAAQAALAGSSRAGNAGWVLVALELIRLNEALQRAHEARGELARAHELHNRAQALLQLAAGAPLDPRARATHTAQHARSGVRVKALDRDNIGTIVGVDDRAGTVTVHFRSPAGHEATRDLPWDKVQVLDTAGGPRPLTEQAKARIARIAHTETTEEAARPPRPGRSTQRDFER